MAVQRRGFQPPGTPSNTAPSFPSSYSNSGVFSDNAMPIPSASAAPAMVSSQMGRRTRSGTQHMPLAHPHQAWEQ